MEVGALSEEHADAVIPDGESWTIRRFTGAGAYLDDTTVSLVWDYGGASPQILAATHGDAQVELLAELVGNGSKILALVLTNDTDSAHTLGGAWEGF